MGGGRRKGTAASVIALATAALVAGVAVSMDDPDCDRQARPVVVDLNDARHANVLDHAHDTIRGGTTDPLDAADPTPPARRQPRLLHLDRKGTESNRRASLAGIPTRPGYDRDEYPPAVSREGGKTAHVRYVPSAENRSAGAVMGRQLRDWCNGQPFRLEDPREEPPQEAAGP